MIWGGGYMSTKRIAGLIIDRIFEEANALSLMHISSRSEVEIAAVYTGLVAFLVAGFRNDNNLCLELTPSFQKRIMRNVTKREYDLVTSVLAHSYEQFRNKGIEIQYTSEDWRYKLKNRYTGMMIDWLCMPRNDYSQIYMNEAFDRLADTAVNTGKNSNISINSPYSANENDTKMVKASVKPQMSFGSEFEQLYYELNKVIQNSKDPLFTDYLKNTLIEAQQNPASAKELRDKVIVNYGTYAKRMAASGQNVDMYYFRSIYGDMDTPEIKSPYSNDIPIMSNNQKRSGTSIIASNTVTKPERFDNLFGKLLYIFGGIPAIFLVSTGLISFVIEFAGDYIDIHSTFGNILTFVIGIFLTILFDFIIMKYFWLDDIITSKGLTIYNFVWVIVTGIAVICIFFPIITWLELTTHIVSMVTLEVFTIRNLLSFNK